MRLKYIYIFLKLRSNHLQIELDQDPRPTFSLLKFINYKAWGIFFLK